MVTYWCDSSEESKKTNEDCGVVRQMDKAYSNLLGTMAVLGDMFRTNLIGPVEAFRFECLGV